ncbi:hypothetical protein HanIR_Chr12g0566961 [Helianthus annuus]|nr:hypothetical protein HanIR_Chr12g0566961 [Helianthus annuus]
MLDEEIGEGIDSILGNPNSVVEKDDIANGKSCFCFDFDFNFNFNYNPCFGYPVGVGIRGNLECKFGFGLRNGVRAMKNVGEGDCWSFPPEATETEKSQIGKKKKVMKVEPECLILGEERSSIENGPRLMLKLSYDKVLNAWSETGSPVPESPGSDIHVSGLKLDVMFFYMFTIVYKIRCHVFFILKQINMNNVSILLMSLGKY